MTTAYTQVRIVERIAAARNEFLRKQGYYGVPNTLYLGFEDLADLMREVDDLEMRPADPKSTLRFFMGMEIIEARRDRHLHVARIV